MAADDDRLAQLEQRITALEDQIAIYQLLMTYGPSADSGSDDVVRAIHHPDAEYDSGLEVFHGADRIGDMIASLPLHRDIMAGGSAHMATIPGSAAQRAASLPEQRYRSTAAPASDFAT
jgi:hypothetical protein